MIMKTKYLNSVIEGFVILTIILIPISCSKQERVRSNVPDETASVSQPVSKAPAVSALRPDGKSSRIEVDILQVWLQSQLKRYGVSDLTTESLVKLLGSEIRTIRFLSASLLGERKEISAIPSLEAALQDESLNVQNAATVALLKMGNRKGIKVLEEFCEKASKEFDEGVYKNTVNYSDALTVLADAGEVSAVPHLRKLLGYQRSWGVRLTTLRSLNKLYKKEPAVLDDIASMLDDEHPHVRKYASDSIQRIEVNK
ncbi:MAG: HEAT repeat domain-containing protein [Planctomycetota bacterium]|jgi:hypothetical protein